MASGARNTVGAVFVLAWLILLSDIPSQYASGQSASAPTVAQRVSRETYVTGKPLNIGNEWALLADDYAVEDRKGISRVIGHAIKLPNNHSPRGSTLGRLDRAA